jgi:type II secretion system protein D
VRLNRTLPAAMTLTEIVRLTAIVTTTGFLALPMAGADAERPAAAPQPTPKQGETAPAPAQPPTDPAQPPADPAQPPAPAPAPQPEPQRDVTPAPSDPRTLSTLEPRTPTQTPPSKLRGGREGRGAIDDELVSISLKDEKADAVVPIIFEWTGKHVSYKVNDLAQIKLNIVGTRKIPKSQALDFLYQTLKMNGIAVTETEDMIFLGVLTDLTKTQPGVVLGPEEDVMTMPDNGLFVTKVFRLQQSRAADVLERIEGLLPEEYAKLSADGGSNQIILSGDVGLAKKVQTLINMLDIPSWNDFATETFRLQYQDATTIANLISELFSDDGSGSSRASGGRTASRQGRQPNVPQAPGQVASGVGGGPIVSVLPSMNSITVRTTPARLAEIRRLVATAWDLPPNAQGSIFKTYDLKYADPAKVRDLLSTLLGGGSRASTTSRAIAGGRALAPQGGGGDGSATAAVANIFSIESYPDSNRLVVISKTPDNFAWLDAWIDQLDQPFNSGIPKNVPLKHASAVELSEILNTLLAQSGSQGGGLRLPEEGLSGLSLTGGEADSAAGGQAGRDAGNQIQFPWQGGRAGSGPGGESAGELSALIGRSRIVPNASQNSVLVMAPPEVEKEVIKIIEDLDKPGRQVMITAVLAEVKVGDGFSWGARIGREGDFATPLNGTENSVTGSIGLELEKGGSGSSSSNFASPWFESSSLTISTTNDLAFFLQALSTDNSVRILQQPRIFTSDNKEAKFEAGSDVSFLTGETSGFGTSGTTTSFNQQFVGVGVNVRPRITQENNVAMEVKILLSNLSSTTINSNPVVDRRETNTTVTVKSGQTIVISGIRREQETQINRRIPFLGDIPILGAAFSSTDRSKEVVELVVFLVPIVVQNPDANDSNFNKAERERLRLLQEPLDKGSRELLQESEFFKSIKENEDAIAGSGADAAGSGAEVPANATPEVP